MPNTNPFKVKLTDAGNRGLTIKFDVSPSVSESRNVNYNSLEPLHAPGQIQVYKNTSSRNFQLSDVRILSRTTEEADKNLRKLWILRSWCMPRFGKSSTITEDQAINRSVFSEEERADKEIFNEEQNMRAFGVELLGAPPPILYFSAYSKTVGFEVTNPNTSRSTNIWKVSQHINRVPVVIQQLTIPYPNDVDYITTSSSTNSVPMPVIMNIDITLMETHSPNSYEGFNLDAYKQGKLQGF